MTEFVSINGIEMEYFSFGRGKKIFVILPGVSVKSVMQSERAICSAYRDFTDDYTVYVFDRRFNMPEDYTIRQMADDTAAVMTELGLSDLYIFGASQGGMIALCLAIYHPELVSKVVLGSSTSRYSSSSSSTDKWIELAQSGDLTALTASFIDSLYSENTLGSYKELLMHMNDDATERDIERFIIQTKAIYGFNVYDQLDKIECPVLVIGVEGDKVIPPSESVAIADKIGCELYMYGKEYGHCVFDEAPDYKQRIIDFFNK